MNQYRTLRLLLIDNHDSFVHNICGLLERVGGAGIFPMPEWDVTCNDAVSVSEAGSYDAFILSPGPGIPREAGRLMETVAAYASSRPMLGICLGFQAIAEHFGARLIHLPVTRHGHPSRLQRIDASDPLLGALAGSQPVVGRYHSWGIDAASLPPELIPTSFDEEGNLMSVRHCRYPLFGTQFHPESIISECGLHILNSFLDTVYRSI